MALSAPDDLGCGRCWVRTNVCSLGPGGHGEGLRRSRGDAAGLEPGASPVDRATVNVGTICMPFHRLRPARVREVDRPDAGRRMGWGGAVVVLRAGESPKRDLRPPRTAPCSTRWEPAGSVRPAPCRHRPPHRAQEDRLRRADPQLERLARAGDRKQAQASGINTSIGMVNRASQRLNKKAIKPPPAATAR